jgi:TfoX/Sxy family transcriptional regulator of competence genes
MAYDEELAARIRTRMDDPLGVSERKMFGGIAFMVYGNMAVGIVGRDLMVRIGTDDYDRALAEPFVRAMDFTGKLLKGFIYVDADGIESDAQLDAWLDRARAFVSTLPPKEEGSKGAMKRTTKKASAVKKPAAKKSSAAKKSQR